MLELGVYCLERCGSARAWLLLGLDLATTLLGPPIWRARCCWRCCTWAAPSSCAGNACSVTSNCMKSAPPCSSLLTALIDEQLGQLRQRLN